MKAPWQLGQPDSSKRDLPESMSLVEEEHSSMLSSSLPSKSSKSSSFFWQSSPAESPDSSSCYRKIDIRDDKYLNRYLADLEGQKEAVKAAWKAQSPDAMSLGNRQPLVL